MNIKRVFAALPLALLFFAFSLLIPFGSNIFEGTLNMKAYAEEQGINQSASTSGGTVKRYIDISSPFSGGYLHEDMKVVGRASITESFTMDNMKPGSNAGSGSDELDFGSSGGSSEEVNEGSDLAEESSSTGSDSSTGSGSTESSKVAAEEETSPPKEAVLGISITSYPTWLDLF